MRSGEKLSSGLGEVACVSVDVTERRIGRERLRARSAAQSTSSSTTRARRKPRRSPKTDMALWQRMLDVNLTGVFLVHARRVARHARTRHGRIVNVASTAGQIGYAYVAAYCAAKHGVIGLTRSLALEVAAQRHHRQCRLSRLHRNRAAARVARTDHQQDLAHRTAGARNLASRESATSLREPGASRQRSAVALPARLGRDHGPVHFHLRWRSNVTKSSNIKKPSRPKQAAAQRRRQTSGERRGSGNEHGVDSHMGCVCGCAC